MILEVILFATIVTGPGKRDVHQRQDMPDLKTCLEAADEFLHHKFPESVDAKRLIAGCDTEPPDDGL